MKGDWIAESEPNKSADAISEDELGEIGLGVQGIHHCVGGGIGNQCNQVAEGKNVNAIPKEGIIFDDWVRRNKGLLHIF